MAAYITRTLAQNNQKLLTISLWVKLAEIQEQDLVTSYFSGAYWGSLRFASDGRLSFQDYRNGYLLNLKTNAQYRDTNAWYHIVANFDCSLSTPTAKLYVNGEEPSLQTSTIYSQNATTSWNTDYTFRIGEGSTLGGNDFEGVMSDVYFIQGYKYDASTFGETDSTTGEWKPILNPTINYGGTGSNSCHLKFENSANMDLDSGDNNLTFTTSGTLTQTQDNPSNNFAVLNRLDRSRKNTNNGGDYLSKGNLTFDTTSSNGMMAIARSTLGVQSGKWYWEAKIIDNSRMSIGITKESIMGKTDPYYDLTDYLAVAMNLNGTITGRYTGSAADEYATGTSNTANDVLGFALDMDNKELYIHKNGTYVSNGSAVGIPTSGASRTGGLIDALTGSRDDYLPDGELIFPFVHDVSTSGAVKVEFNFGSGFFGTTAISSEGTNASGIGKFEYDVPANFTALCTKGLNE